MLRVSQYFNNKSELEVLTNNSSRIFSPSLPLVCLFFSLPKFTVIYMIIYALYFQQIDLFQMTIKSNSSTQTLISTTMPRVVRTPFTRTAENIAIMTLGLVARTLMNTRSCQVFTFEPSLPPALPMTVTNRVKHYAEPLMFHLDSNIYISLSTSPAHKSNSTRPPPLLISLAFNKYFRT